MNVRVTRNCRPRQCQRCNSARARGNDHLSAAVALATLLRAPREDRTRRRLASSAHCES